MLQILQLALGLFILAASLGRGKFGGIEIPARESALLEEIFSCVVNFLLSVKCGLGGGSVELRFLNLLGKICAGGGGLAGLRLLEFALALFGGAGEIGI